MAAVKILCWATLAIGATAASSKTTTEQLGFGDQCMLVKPVNGFLALAPGDCKKAPDFTYNST